MVGRSIFHNQQLILHPPLNVYVSCFVKFNFQAFCFSYEGFTMYGKCSLVFGGEKKGTKKGVIFFIPEQVKIYVIFVLYF